MPKPKAEKPISKKRVRAALDRLKALPDEGSERRVAVPFPIATEDKRPGVDATTLRGAVHGTVRLGDLYATQPTVRRKRVKKFIKEREGYKHLPTVIRMDGKTYIGNGHHRLAAAKLLGCEACHANIVAIDQMSSSPS